MPDSLAPGVYVEEVPSVPRAIEGVPTSTAAFLGVAERGPVEPRLVTGVGEYRRLFGAACGPDAYLRDAVQGFFENGGQRLYVCNIAGEGARTASLDLGNGFTVRACGPGAWGNRVWVLVRPGGAHHGGPPTGFRLSIACFAEGHAGFDPFLGDDDPGAPPPQLVEDFDGLVTDAASPDYVGKRLPFIDLAKGPGTTGPDSSALIVLERAADADPDAWPLPGTASMPLAGGDSGRPPGAADFEGRVAGERTGPQGFAALEAGRFDEVALVYAPARPDVANAAVAHCRAMRFRFAVIDVDRDAPLDGVDAAGPDIDSVHAACYGPWLWVQGAAPGERRLVPPGGHVLGIYARADAGRGVFKAPANEVVHGVLDLQHRIGAGQQERLVLQGINLIRDFPGRGIRVWGARTLASNPEWRYVNVRRYAMFLERSILEGTRWAVFEPNAPPLWTRVAALVREFLRAQWLLGGLQGAKEEHAFHVACGVGVSMSEDDVRDGRLVCEVGVAMLRPAEFTLLRVIQRMAAGPP